MTTTSTTAFRQRVLDALAVVRTRLRPVHQQIVARLRDEDVEIWPRMFGDDSDKMACCTPAGTLRFAQTLCEDLPGDLLKALVAHEAMHLIALRRYPEIWTDEIWADAQVRAMGLEIDALNDWIKLYQPALL